MELATAVVSAHVVFFLQLQLLNIFAIAASEQLPQYKFPN